MVLARNVDLTPVFVAAVKMPNNFYLAIGVCADVEFWQRLHLRVCVAARFKTASVHPVNTDWTKSLRGANGCCR